MDVMLRRRGRSRDNVHLTLCIEKSVLKSIPKDNYSYSLDLVPSFVNDLQHFKAVTDRYLNFQPFVCMLLKQVQTEIVFSLLAR